LAQLNDCEIEIKMVQKKKFFIKEDDGIYTVTDVFFDDIESRSEALVIALRTIGEINNVLADEALGNGPLFIGTMKVITGLQRCLDELERRWPFLMLEMRTVSRRIDGQVLGYC
jgi:hypothetical protein